MMIPGCGSATSSDRSSAGAGQHAHGGDAHSHHHDHGDIGPNGGHLIELGDGDFHAEWLHEDETGKVTVIVLDGNCDNEVGISAESINIDVAVADASAPQSYQLRAIGRSEGNEPTASRFELTDESLLVALKVGEGVTATLNLDIDGKQYMGRIEHHEHGGHSHDH
jgi:hypothetical protein